MLDFRDPEQRLHYDEPYQVPLLLTRPISRLGRRSANTRIFSAPDHRTHLAHYALLPSRFGHSLARSVGSDVVRRVRFPTTAMTICHKPRAANILVHERHVGCIDL